jgi:hypothetical protein
LFPFGGGVAAGLIFGGIGSILGSLLGAVAVNKLADWIIAKLVTAVEVHQDEIDTYVDKD